MVKRILEALKRAVTLPARYNSAKDIASDPAGAVKHASEQVTGAIRRVTAYSDDLRRLAADVRAIASSVEILAPHSVLGKRLRGIADSLDEVADVLEVVA